MSQNVDLKTLVRRLERRHQKRQAGVALLALVGFLGLGSVAVPLALGTVPGGEPEPVAVVEPGPAPLPPEPEAFDDVAIEGRAAIVYDLSTGQVLYEKNARSQLPLASLTKLLTVYAGVQNIREGATVAISGSALASEGESGFVEGERFRFGDLAAFTLVSSSNDAAAAIAETAALAKAETNRQMLAGAAAAAGLAQTYALNGTGLDESASISGGYGSAHDVALLSGALLKAAPEIARATLDPSATVRSLDGASHTLPNTNPNARAFPGLLLSKTGFTDLAGGNLSVVYDAGLGHPVAIVVLGSSREGRFTDVARLRARADAHFAGLSR